MVEFRGLVMPRGIVRSGWFVGLFPHGQVGICIRTADGYPFGYGFAICAKEQKNGLVVDFDLFPIESTGGGDGAADELRLHHHLPMLPPLSSLLLFSPLARTEQWSNVQSPQSMPRSPLLVISVQYDYTHLKGLERRHIQDIGMLGSCFETLSFVGQKAI